MVTDKSGSLVIGTKYLVAQLAVPIIVKEREHNISKVIRELNMSNSPAKQGEQMKRKRGSGGGWAS